MNCKKVKELIMDYIDGEAATPFRDEIKKHLDSCAGCRQYRDALLSKVITPATAFKKEKAPEELWDKVKARIEKRRDEGALAGFFMDLGSFLAKRKPALVLAAAAALIIAVLVRVNLPFDGERALTEYIQEQEELFYYLTSDNTLYKFDMEMMDFGTAIEEYLF